MKNTVQALKDFNIENVMWEGNLVRSDSHKTFFGF